MNKQSEETIALNGLTFGINILEQLPKQALIEDMKIRQKASEIFAKDTMHQLSKDELIKIIEKLEKQQNIKMHPLVNIQDDKAMFELNMSYDLSVPLNHDGLKKILADRYNNDITAMLGELVHFSTGLLLDVYDDMDLVGAFVDNELQIMKEIKEKQKKIYEK